MKACFMGLGYIGLPTAIIAAKHGVEIAGVDINAQVVEVTNQGKLHIIEPGMEDMLREVLASGHFKAYTEPQVSDAYFMVVPTPFKGDHEPDVSFVESATRMVLPLLKEGDLYVIESTSPVGTTERMARLIFSERPELEGVLLRSGYDVNRLVEGKRLVLITGHRRENFGDGFIHMCTAIKDLTKMYPEVDFVYPMHLNPNVRKPIHEVFGEDLSHLENMFFIEPLEYLSFVYLMEKSTIVLTDSGGIQEEAPGLGKPVLVMRDTTERPEALAAGTVKLVGTDYDKIVSEVSALLDDTAYYDAMSKAVNPYGDGLACGRIVEFLNRKE